MIFLVVADVQQKRQQHIATIVTPESEVLVFDETYGTLMDLEQYLYPSLFSIAPPIVQVKFMLTELLDTVFLKKLLASPTIFLFEEMVLPSPIITAFKKAGAVVHTEEKIKKETRGADIFGATLALTAKDKKARWMAYRAALDEHPIEAIIGILYWKIRDMATKNPKEKSQHLGLYKKLLNAHARAWESGAPLELMIEKVILS